MNSIVNDLRFLIGGHGVIEGTGEHAHPFLLDSRGDFEGCCQAICLPETQEHVIAIVRYAYEHGIAIIPQGGNTGRVAGATPMIEKSIVLNTSRLNKILDINPVQYSMIVEAGCVLQDIIDAAAAHHMFFPLSLGSQNKCHIGGNVATNAGGVHVVKYGMTRDLIAGLEVVLPGGDVWDGIRYPIKGNMGYDLKHCFIGSEGTLGIVTKVALKLFPPVRNLQAGFCSFETFGDVLNFYKSLKENFGELLQTFEIVPQFALHAWQKESQDILFTEPFAWAVLMEISSSYVWAGDLLSKFISGIPHHKMIEYFVTSDALLIERFWQLRHGIVTIQKDLGLSIKHDISIPTMYFEDFMEEAEKKLKALSPLLTPYPFGHLGDGNLHYNVLFSGDKEHFVEIKERVHEIVYSLVRFYRGHISAEHGIGRIKRDLLKDTLPAPEIVMMQAIKKSLDPQGLMNPCVLL